MLRNFSFIFIVIIIGLTSGCQENDDIILDSGQEDNFIDAELDTQFQLKVNQIAILKDQNIRAEFLDVPEDSRCPSDVVCIWAGQVKALVNIMMNDQDLGDLILTERSGDDELNTGGFGDFSIKLVKVDPYPVSTKKIELTDYIATFIITRK